jgi:protein gp37
MTKIEWTEKTWNPIIGCSKISPGCQNCYAEKMAGRLSMIEMKKTPPKKIEDWAYPKVVSGYRGKGIWSGKTAFVESALEKPLHWKKPSMIFVCSMSDLFHESVSDEWILSVFDIIKSCPQHTFQVLTKRPERMKEFYRKHWPVISKDGNYIPDNLWLGVTAENQEMATKRIPVLLSIPAAVRFVSVEPMLARMNLAPYLPEADPNIWPYESQAEYISRIARDDKSKLDWVIVGAETGHSRRPCKQEWIDDAVEQCEESGVPVFVKKINDENGKVIADHKYPREWPNERAGL